MTGLLQLKTTREKEGSGSSEGGAAPEGPEHSPAGMWLWRDH